MHAPKGHGDNFRKEEEPDAGVLKNTDTGSANGDISDDVLRSELRLEEMSAVDEEIVKRLHKAKLSKAKATDALRLLRGSLPEKRADAVTDDIARLGFRLSTPALVRYLLDITAGKRVDERVKDLIDDARQGMQRVRQVHVEVDREETAILRDADLNG